MTPLRVLVVAANQEQRPDPVVPLGALYVAGAARQAGHEVRLYDACFDGAGFAAALERECLSFLPDVVGLSIRNVDDVAWPRATSYLAHYQRVMDVLRRSAPQAPVVVGGSAFTLFPDAFLHALGADYGVVGDGEEAFTALLAEMAPGGLAPGHGGLSGPHPRLVSGRSGNDVLDTAEPAMDLADLDRYLKLGGAINVQTRRGCAFGCSYCTYPRLEGARPRPRDPERCADLVERLHRERGIDSFFVVDNVFNAPSRHALAFCEALRRRALPVRWTAYVTPAGLTPEVAAAMAGAGCTGVELGTESAAAPTLAALGKPFTPEEVVAAARACRNAGLRTCHSLILGGPDETWATLEETACRIDETRPDAVVAMLGVRLYPGTGLARRLQQEGALGRDDIGLDPVFHLSEAVRDGLEDWARSRSSARRNWIFPGLQVEGDHLRSRALRRGGIRGPLWELLSA